MEIKSKERKKMKMFEKIIVTKHFIERYCQRILNISDHMEFQEVKDLVLEDMVERMTIIEKECIEIPEEIEFMTQSNISKYIKEI